MRGMDADATYVLRVPPFHARGEVADELLKLVQLSGRDADFGHSGGRMRCRRSDKASLWELVETTAV